MIEFAPGTLHVWRLRVDRDRRTALLMYGLLDRTERERANRFRFERDAVCFVLTRAHLRLILASALGVDAAAVQFCHEAAGKPRLKGEGGPWFNVSHSGAFAVLAVAADRRVGVDVERIRPMPGRDLGLYLSEDEVSDLERLPEPERQRAFFRCWTRKESFLKARGSGLGFGLQRFSVTLDSERPPRLLHVDGEPEAPALWDLRDLAMDPAYSASLAAEAPITKLFCRDIDELR
jgi:4'-phosphopantetheinyl transferase